MSVQIAARLPADIAEFVDREVAEGRASSGAAVVLRALERERRRTVTPAEHDISVLIASGSLSDLDGLARRAAALRLDIE